VTDRVSGCGPRLLLGRCAVHLPSRTNPIGLVTPTGIFPLRPAGVRRERVLADHHDPAAADA